MSKNISNDFYLNKSISNNSLYATLEEQVVATIEANPTPLSGEFTDGTVSNPSITFEDDLDTGIYRIGTNEIGFSCGGSEVFRIGELDSTKSVPLNHADGSVSSPSITFSSDIDSGLYLIGDGNIGVSIAGEKILDLSQSLIENKSTQFTYKPLNETNTTCDFLIQVGDGISAYDDVFRVDESNITSSVAYLNESGNSTNPSYSFSSDSNSGFYRIGSDNIGFSTGGTLRLDIDTVDIISSLPILGPNGSSTTPSLGFSSDVDSGLYLIGDGNIGVSIAGGLTMDLNSSRLNLVGNILLANTKRLCWVDDNWCIGRNIATITSGTELLTDNTIQQVIYSAEGDQGFQFVGTPDMLTNNQILMEISGKIDSSEAVQIHHSASSTSTTTGALKVIGGISTQDNLYVGENTVIQKYTTSQQYNFKHNTESGIEYRNVIDTNGWATTTIPASNLTIWEYVLYEPTNNVFIACGDGVNDDDYGFLIRSVDGVNWSEVIITGSIDANFDANSLAYSTVLDRFICVGDGASDVLYSDDAGENWTVSNAAMPQDANWIDVAYSDTLDLFVAINDDNATNHVAYSSDGENWTGAVAASDDTWRRIEWNPTEKLFISCNNAFSTTESVMTSADAINWTNRNTPSGIGLLGIAHSSELGITLLFGFTTVAFKSIDGGITWTSITVPDIDSCLRAIWTGTMFFVSGLNGKYMYSYDSENWVEDIFDTADWYGCAYGDSKFVLVGNNAPTLAYTIDFNAINIFSEDTQLISAQSNAIINSVPNTLPSYSTGNYPSNVAAGSLIFSSTVSKIAYFDGTDWRRMDTDATIT
jgi:hypothetical protein